MPYTKRICLYTFRVSLKNPRAVFSAQGFYIFYLPNQPPSTARVKPFT